MACAFAPAAKVRTDLQEQSGCGAATPNDETDVAIALSHLVLASACD